MNNYQGDPAISITPDGASMVFNGGQPVMDQGLNNAAIILEFTKKTSDLQKNKKGWWGNFFFKDPDQKIGSDYEAQNFESITVNSLIDTEQAAKAALQPLVNKNIAKVSAVTVNPSGLQRDTTILLEPLSRDAQELLLQQNGQNWINQAINPAHVRLK